MASLIGQLYESPEEAREALNETGKVTGEFFVIHTKKPSTANCTTVIFRCKNGRQYISYKNEAIHSSKKRKSSSQMEDCPRRIKLRLGPACKWELQRIDSDIANTHNHELRTNFIPSEYRKSAIEQRKSEVLQMYNNGIKPSKILEVLRSDSDNAVAQATRHNLTAILRNERANQLNGKSPIEWLIDTLSKRSDIIFMDKRDPNGRIESLFITPKSGLQFLRQYPDIILCDATYKTNRFNMPLFNICGATSMKKTFHVAAVFISAERKDDFKWILFHYLKLLEKSQLPTPRVIISNRDLAFINALESFQELKQIPHFLCQWHINLNITAKYAKYFPKARRNSNGEIERYETFNHFLYKWKRLLASETLSIFLERLAKFSAPGKFPKSAVDYALKVWISPFKEKLVSCYINKTLHFGHTTTSIVESLHTGIKRMILSSQCDLASAFEALIRFWKVQEHGINSDLAIRQQKTLTSARSHLFSHIRTRITPIAIELLNNELATFDHKDKTVPSEPCNPCAITRVHGLPCKHILWAKIHESTYIKPDEVDRYWHWDRFFEQSDSTFQVPLDPSFMHGKGRPRGSLGLEKGRISHSTKQDPSLHKIVKANKRQEAIEASKLQMQLLSTPSLTSHEDLYEPGTEPPRSYQHIFQSIQEDFSESSLSQTHDIEESTDSQDAEGEDYIETQQMIRWHEEMERMHEQRLKEWRDESQHQENASPDQMYIDS